MDVSATLAAVTPVTELKRLMALPLDEPMSDSEKAMVFELPSEMLDRP